VEKGPEMNFIDFARANGVEIDYSKLFASEKIRRCGTTERPRSLNGAYFWDGTRGWVMDWSGEARIVWWNDPDAKPWSADEKRLWALRRVSAASDQDKRYEQAALQAEITLRSATMNTHPYLIKKGFDSIKGLVLDDKLLIPMRNVGTHALQGYQSICLVGDKFEKKMLTGMRAKNAVMCLGERKAPETWLVEGFATGLSVRAALRSVGLAASVVVAFSASNLVQVADQIGGDRYVFADNDESGTGQRIAEQTGLPWTMANEVGWDANDLHKAKGLFSVVGKIMDCRIKECA
jgi:hypothetical protein